MSRLKYTQEAADALCRLNNYGAIQALCESGLFPGRNVQYGSAVSKITQICKGQMRLELTRYDKALLQVEKAKT